jgi:transposase-like protein
VAGKNGGNSRNGKRSKTGLTDVGLVEISVPRDRDGSFELKIVKKTAETAARKDFPIDHICEHRPEAVQ